MKTIENVLLQAKKETNKEYKDHDVSDKSLEEVIACLTKYPLDDATHNKKRLKILSDLIERDSGARN